MRIFIQNYNLSKINSKIKQLDKYLVNTLTYYEYISLEGIFTIDKTHIHRLIHNDSTIKIIQKYVCNFTIIVDYSKTEKIEEFQIPPDAIVLLFHHLHYSITPNSKIKLVIEKKVNENENEDEVITDFYFELNEEHDINNIFIKKELNVFLSLLN